MMITAVNAKFKAADVARWLKLTPGAISQYLSGKTTPKQGVIELFRQRLQENVGPAIPEASPAELHERLKDLERYDPAAFDAARATIETLHGRMNKGVIHADKHEVNSAEEPLAVRVLKRGPVSGHKRGGDQSS